MYGCFRLREGTETVTLTLRGVRCPRRRPRSRTPLVEQARATPSALAAVPTGHGRVIVPTADRQAPAAMNCREHPGRSRSRPSPGWASGRTWWTCHRCARRWGGWRPTRPPGDAAEDRQQGFRVDGHPEWVLIIETVGPGVTAGQRDLRDARDIRESLGEDRHARTRVAPDLVDHRRRRHDVAREDLPRPNVRAGNVDRWPSRAVRCERMQASWAYSSTVSPAIDTNAATPRCASQGRSLARNDSMPGPAVRSS